MSLLEGYDSATYRDEAIEDDGSPRAHYLRVLAALERIGADALARRVELREVVQRSRGVTFTMRTEGAETERTFPLDLVPRIIPAAEWAHLEDTDSVRATIDWMGSAMTYEPGTTEVGTPVVEILAARAGVCQDYAHLCCAILRTLEIPSRYVSGYFAPRPLKTGESVEAESHAWVEALLPDTGWLPIDPTNDIEPAERHVKVGHGRDYTDVVPFQGVHAGEAAQTLEVGVTITRLG